MYRIIISVVLAAVVAASAQADSIYVGALTKHPASVGATTERHALLIYEKDKVLIGAFENSFGDPTVVAAKAIVLDEFFDGAVLARVFVGATYGYRGCSGELDDGDPTLCPAVVPEVTFNAKGTFQPTFALMGKAAVFTLKIDLNSF